MKVKSRDFQDNDSIPSQFTCDGEDISPHLSWEEVPEEAESFALSVEDPDAPMGTFVHWLVYDIPKEITNLNQNSLPVEAKQVTNDFGKEDYGGPCPPSGTHRYIFTIYALKIDHLKNVNKRNFFDLIRQHTLDKAVITGLYKRR